MKNLNIPSSLCQGEMQKSILSSRQNPTKSPLISGTGRSSIFSPPYGGGTFCEAKGGGALGRGVRAFTLVELIIVITILAILATIAFMSFQGYMKQSRDAVRVSDLANASKGLSIFFTKSGVYPEAENPVTITASGNTLSSQGTLGESVVRAINMNQVPLDPVDQSKYTYSTNAQKTKYQLMTYTENASLASMMTQSYAQDLTDRGIQMQGDGLGILLNPDNSLPTISSVDAYSGTETYKIVFDNDTVLEGSGNLVFSQIYNMRDDLLKNKELAKLDNALVGYWDMETTFQSGSFTMLKDLSKYGNHGTCYNSGSIVPCGGASGPQLVSGEGKTGKAMSFDGVDDRINGNLQITPTNFTILAVLKPINHLFQQNLLFIGKSSPANRSGLYINTSGIMRFWNGPNTFQDLSSNTKINNESILLAGTKDNEIERIYIDGLLKNSSRHTGYTLNDNNYVIGADIGGGIRYYGLIDEVRIYNRALSDSEIQALYSATK